MKRVFVAFTTILFTFSLILSSCTTEEPTIIDSALPSGLFSADRAGSLVAENGTPTTGGVELGTDEENTSFIRFGSDFTTELATGTVAVYLSTSEVFTADPGNGNPDLRLIGAINSNGEQFFKLTEAVSSEFTHVILWCNTASIPFGNAELK